MTWTKAPSHLASRILPFAPLPICLSSSMLSIIKSRKEDGMSCLSAMLSFKRATSLRMRGHWSVSLVWPDLFRAWCLLIRDYKRPRLYCRLAIQYSGFYVRGPKFCEICELVRHNSGFMADFPSSQKFGLVLIIIYPLAIYGRSCIVLSNKKCS